MIENTEVKKVNKTFSLSPEAVKNLEYIAEKTYRSSTGVLEYLINKEYNLICPDEAVSDDENTILNNLY